MSTRNPRAASSTASTACSPGWRCCARPRGRRSRPTSRAPAGWGGRRTPGGPKTATEKPVGVAIWTNEEGSRFVPVMGGSGAFAGVFTLEHLLAQRDVDGITFGDWLRGVGYAGSTPVGGRALDSYFEAHIEQGPILEREHKV